MKDSSTTIGMDRSESVELASMLELFYSRVLHWKRYPTNREGIVAYQEDRVSSPLEALIPQNAEMPDFRQLLQCALEVASYAVNRPTVSLLQMLTHPDMDFCDCRVMTSRTDSAPVLLVEDLIRTTRESLEDAYKFEQQRTLASMEKEERDRHPKLSDFLATFTKDCRFAHTWRGSFGMTVYVPLHLESFGFLDDPQPAGASRRAMERFLHCYDCVAQAKQRNTHRAIIDSLSPAPDAKLLGRIVELQGSIGDQNVEISARLSPLVVRTGAIDPAKPIPIDAHALEFAAKALEELAPHNEPQEDVFYGFPRMLAADKSDLVSDIAEGHRKVRVDGLSRTTGHASLDVDLSLEDYNKALAAQQLVCNIRMRCRVVKRARGWEVIELKSFDLLPDDARSN